MDSASRTVLIIGAAVFAGGIAEGTVAQQAAAPAAAPAASAAAAAPATPQSLYPSPEFPTCIAKGANDCKLPDGHPDLTGLWVNGQPTFGNGGGALASGAAEQVFAGRGNSFVGFEADGGLFRETRDYYGPFAPQYKPEYWETIVDNEYNGNFEDPVQDCLPNGVPRVGAPGAIVALPNQPWVVLFYNDVQTFGIKVRVVPTDGRPHNVTNVASETWDGDPVGHWDGDTLVIETVGFTDSSWLGKSGFVHGFNMKVTETFKREGNNLTYQVTVDDPEYLVKPWVQAPIMRTLVTDPNATLYEALPCNDIDHLHVTSHVRSG